eukprot:84130_1
MACLKKFVHRSCKFAVCVVVVLHSIPTGVLASISTAASTPTHTSSTATAPTTDTQQQETASQAAPIDPKLVKFKKMLKLECAKLVTSFEKVTSWAEYEKVNRVYNLTILPALEELCPGDSGEDDCANLKSEIMSAMENAGNRVRQKSVSQAAKVKEFQEIFGSHIEYLEKTDGTVSLVVFKVLAENWRLDLDTACNK